MVPPVAVSVVLDPLQIVVVPDTPVGATDGVFLVITTSSWELVHTPLAKNHLNVFAPTARPFTAVVGLLALTKVPEPETTLHAPAPVVGLFPARVADAVHTIWSVPAVAVVNSSTVTSCEAQVVVLQAPLYLA